MSSPKADTASLLRWLRQARVSSVATSTDSEAIVVLNYPEAFQLFMRIKEKL